MPSRSPEKAKQPRRTQDERSATTRAQLLDATIECLVELGYSATTTTVIAERAGVSRGAQLHHYPTKAELVAAAVEHLATKLTHELTGAIARAATETDRVAAAIDVMWAAYSTPLFTAWLELWVAARTDADLRAALDPVEKRLTLGVARAAAEVFPGNHQRDTDVQRVLEMTLCLFQGIALRRTLSPGRRSHRPSDTAMLDLWREMAAAALHDQVHLAR